VRKKLIREIAGVGETGEVLAEMPEAAE